MAEGIGTERNGNIKRAEIETEIEIGTEVEIETEEDTEIRIILVQNRVFTRRRGRMVPSMGSGGSDECGELDEPQAHHDRFNPFALSLSKGKIPPNKKVSVRSI